MPVDDYLFMLELSRDTGESLGRVAIVPDWDPAVEWTRLAGLRAHGVWAADSSAERGVEPLWHNRLGEPFVDRFRVHLAAPTCAWFEDFPATKYFADAARDASARLVESGTVQAGDHVRYRPTAFARSDRAAPSSPFQFDAADAPPRLALKDTPVTRLLDASTPCGDAQPADVEVFVPQSVMEEASALTAGAGASETGGILIGHLHRDGERGEIFVEVTAQIPARHTASDALKLTFTSDTWTDVRAALALRRRDELMLGWWHSHPAREWCKACPPENQRVCRLATPFLSVDDRALHRAMFPRAFTLALLMTNALSGISAALFGWRTGLLEPRGFRVLSACTTHLRTNVSTLGASPA